MFKLTSEEHEYFSARPLVDGIRFVLPLPWWEYLLQFAAITCSQNAQ